MIGLSMTAVLCILFLGESFSQRNRKHLTPKALLSGIVSAIIQMFSFEDCN